MPEDYSFDELAARLRSGDQDAAARVFELFAKRLIALARARLDRLVRQKVDPEDVVQSVFRSFFARRAAGQFDLISEDSLWALLVEIALRKCGRWNQQFRRRKRRVDLEVPLQNGSHAAHHGWEPLAHGPSPEDAAALAETVELLMRRLENKHEQQVLELRLQGYTIEEISSQVRCSERTVYRVLDRVKKWIVRMREGS